MSLANKAQVVYGNAQVFVGANEETQTQMLPKNPIFFVVQSFSLLLYKRKKKREPDRIFFVPTHILLTLLGGAASFFACSNECSDYSAPLFFVLAFKLCAMFATPIKPVTSCGGPKTPLSHASPHSFNPPSYILWRSFVQR